MKKTKQTAIAICLFALILTGYLSTIYLYFAEEGDKRANIIKSPSVSDNGEYLEITVSIIVVDLQKENLELRVDFRPHGDLALAEGVLARPLTVYMTNVNGASIEFPAGQRMLARDVKFDLHDGEVTDYPFDSHKSLIEFLAVEKTENTSDPPRSVPTEVDFYAYHHGLSMALKPFASNEGGFVGFEATVTRSRLVIGLAIFYMLIMWCLAFSAILILWSAMKHNRKAETRAIALLSGLIIAIYFIRTVLPDTPMSIGTFSDFLAFFWVEAIVSLVTMIYTMVWFQQGKEY